nr:putative defensin-like protein 271 [Coffea arabica]
MASRRVQLVSLILMTLLLSGYSNGINGELECLCIYIVAEINDDDDDGPFSDCKFVGTCTTRLDCIQQCGYVDLHINNVLCVPGFSGLQCCCIVHVPR